MSENPEKISSILERVMAEIKAKAEEQCTLCLSRHAPEDCPLNAGTHGSAPEGLG